MTATDEEAPVPTRAPVANPEMDSRYGRTPRFSRRSKLISYVTAGAFALVFGAWLLWAGILGAPAQLDARDTAHNIVSPTEVSVSWELTVAPGTATSCAVQALNADFSVVGWKVVPIAASQQRTRTFTQSLKTSELSVTGLIYRCWLT